MCTSSPFTLVDHETGTLVNELMTNLRTGESIKLAINYNTQYKSDLHNEITNGLLNINYSEHQHDDVVNLIGHIYFPNIHLEMNQIDFGCILNNTEVTQVIKMTNIGPLEVNYKWKFVLEKDNIVFNMGLSDSQTNRSIEYDSKNFKLDLDDKNEENQDGNNYANSQSLIDQSKAQIESKLEEIMTRSGERELPTIEEIFNITPLFGTLNAGEVQNLTITYFGHKEIQAYVKAVCEVQNGPDYELYVRGEASVLNYELDTRHINLGNIVKIYILNFRFKFV